MVAEERQSEVVEDSDSDGVMSLDDESINKDNAKGKENGDKEKPFHPAFVSFRSYRRKHFFKSSNDCKSK